MYNVYPPYQNPYYGNMPMYNSFTSQMYNPGYPTQPTILRDYGPQPYVVNINMASKQNNNYRTALWTGDHLQVTLMSIKPGDDIGLEVHPNVDQFLRIEEGQGIVKMGPSRVNLNYQRNVGDDFAIMVPAGTWHDVINTGNKPLKLYSIYAPPNHPRGVIHRTKQDAQREGN